MRLRTALACLLGFLLSACQLQVRAPAPAAANAAPAGQSSAMSARPEPAHAAATQPKPSIPLQTPTLAPPDPTRSGAQVFDRLRPRLSADSCHDDAGSRSWRQRYAGHPDTFARRIEAILPLFDYVSREVLEAGLPGEFALIPVVESWYRPEATGLGGPAGLWQMVGATARHNGLHVDRRYDGRYSPLDSTAAALKHLGEMQQRFGDWRLAVMAYNAGEYRLLKALQRSGDERVDPAQRRPPGLSRTTYDYVTKLQSLACLILQPERQNLRLPEQSRFLPLQALVIPGDFATLDAFAQGRGLDAGALRQLNPAYRQGRIAADAPRRVLAAVVDATGPVAAATSDPEGAEANEPAPPRQHVIRRGDTLSALAARYGVRVEQLLRWNGLRLSSILRLGQVLQIAPP